MSKQGYDFNPFQVQHQQEMLNAVESVNKVFTSLALNDDQKLRQAISFFLSRLNQNINSNLSSPKSKLMSVFMLRQFTDRSVRSEKKEYKNTKLFSILMNHPILNNFGSLAQTIDPYKSLNLKGKNYFSNDEMTGHDFIRIILELLKYWAIRYARTKTGEHTGFLNLYNYLLDKNVIFPNEYTYFIVPPAKKDRKGEYIDSSHGINSMTSLVQPSPQDSKTNVNYMYIRLQSFIQLLGDNNQIFIEKQIKTVHGLIQKQTPKFDNMSGEILETNNEDIIQKYFNLKDLMSKQVSLHQSYIQNSNDHNTYIKKMKQEGEKVFFPKKNGQAMTTVSNYFNQIQQRSKSPISGIQKVNQSLAKEKTAAISTVRRSISPINRSSYNMSISKSMTSLSSLNISSIFTDPPNLNPPLKNYEGQEITSKLNINTSLFTINKTQGLRRFKTANFKSKSLLFQNEQIQIGCQSKPIYQDVSGFTMLIMIQLYIGNLVEGSIQNLNLDFKGDENLLLYVHPKNIKNTLKKDEQQKIQLIIVPVSIPYPFLTMTLSYKYSGFSSQYRIVLPNSVLKLTYFIDISKAQFLNRWKKSKIYKTREFKLCHYLSPDAFRKWFSSWGELSSYLLFAAPGSNLDYQLYSSLIIMQQYQGLLKINFRPNLRVTIQVGIEDENSQSINHFRFFLQTMEEFLKQIQ